MSLCFANVTMNGLLISTDGVAMNKDNEIVKNDQQKLFKITDNLAIFVSGELNTNLEVIEILLNESVENFSSLEKANETIKEVCKNVYDKYKKNVYVLGWEYENRNRANIKEENRMFAIPISLTAFYYDTAYHCTNFTPTEFEPDHSKMKMNQTFLHGYMNLEAGKILKRTMGKVRSLEGDIERFENCYREIENQYKGIGGNTKYFLMTDDSFSLIKEMKKE